MNTKCVILILFIEVLTVVFVQVNSSFNNLDLWSNKSNKFKKYTKHTNISETIICKKSADSIIYQIIYQMINTINVIIVFIICYQLNI